MAQHSQPSNYTQGYSNYTVATHQSRTAESDAAFLLPHIKKTGHILDVGCGPGTITTGLAKYASEGTTVGIDISIDVLQKAKTLAAEANVPTQGLGSIVFKEGNVLEGLAHPDDTFDIVYCSQLFGHLLPALDLPLRALAEMRRVLKPGGILATRDAADSHFYPRSLDLDRLWVRNLSRGLHKGAPDADPRGRAFRHCSAASALELRCTRGQKPGSGWPGAPPASRSREIPSARAGWMPASPRTRSSRRCSPWGSGLRWRMPGSRRCSARCSRGSK
jgi:ubiquinone/menaquinone biosynthesis C-methylase UbiE